MFLECDYDGKFSFVDEDLKKKFNYLNEDFIKSNRLFNLIHPDSVIYFIDIYNSFLQDSSTNIEFNLTFLGLNAEKINYFIKLEKIDNRIKVTFSNFDKTSLIKEKKSNIFIKFLFLTRVKFIIGSLMPFIFAIIWSYFRYENISILLCLLAFLSLFLLHMSANTFNDYFDWKSGRDKLNTDYVFSSTGGSRSIDLKLVSEKTMLYISLFLIMLVLFISIYFIYLRGLLILLVGLIALFSIYFYSAPPIHLASRRGLGELMHIFCLGPLIIYGTVYLFSGENDFLTC
ncbi:MAG TPA: prenyltransferase [Candidatus Azoamicus sp.]